MTSRGRSVGVLARTTVWRKPKPPEPAAPRVRQAREATAVHTRVDTVVEPCRLEVPGDASRTRIEALRPSRRLRVAQPTSLQTVVDSVAPREAEIADVPTIVESPLGLTPAIEREVYQLARRIALQAHLPAAMHVLHHGLSRLTASPDALCIFFDPALCSASVFDGSAARQLDDDVQQLVAQVAGSSRRAVLDRVVLEPIGPAPARAVLMVRRSSTGPAYGRVEVEIIAAIATAVVGLVGHFAADHGVRREQELRDARTPFRPQALAEHRGATAAPGRLVSTPRTWIRWAYPSLIGMVAAVLVAAAIIDVPTYSTGVSIITLEGEQITSPMPGTVGELLVAPGGRVAIGDPVLRLRSPTEDAELAAAETDYRNALATFLTTPGNDGARNELAAISTRRQRAKAAVDARTLRAPAAGVIGDVRVRTGQLVNPGAELMKVAPSDEPSVIALLPGKDRPRLELGMTLQIDLPGYHKKREEAVIDVIGSQVIGPEEARHSVGGPIGDALPITGPVVLVHAHLTTRTFEAGGREYAFHDGMVGKAEVQVDHDSLLRVLLPGKED